MSKVKQNQLDQPILNSSMSRQAVINSNFDVWQRGTTSATLADTAAVYTADRWWDTHGDDGGTLPTLTRTRQALTPGDIANAFYYSRLTTNGAGTSLGAGSYGNYIQRIEHGTRLLCGLNKKVTISFWARSDIANKKIGINLKQNYGTTGSPTSQEVINGTNWTLTSTWTKYNHTFTTNTLVGKTFGTSNNDFIGVEFWLMWGSTYQDRVGASTAETYVGAGNIDIAQVQLCAGDVALPFMPKSYEEELRACQRYYEKTDYLLASSGIYATGYWKVEKRISPTITITNRSTGSGGAVGASSYNPTSSFWITSYATDAANAAVTGEAEL